MPALSFLAFVAFGLVALLFVGNATLEPTSPAIVTTHHTVAPAPGPAPNLTSQVAEPKSAPDALAKVRHAARAARAEVPKKRFTWSRNYERTSFFDRFSLKNN
jgi:hypothetical protein